MKLENRVSKLESEVTLLKKSVSNHEQRIKIIEDKVIGELEKISKRLPNIWLNLIGYLGLGIGICILVLVLIGASMYL